MAERWDSWAEVQRRRLPTGVTVQLAPGGIDYHLEPWAAPEVARWFRGGMRGEPPVEREVVLVGLPGFMASGVWRTQWPGRSHAPLREPVWRRLLGWLRR